MTIETVTTGLSLDQVLLVPRASDVLPISVVLGTQLSPTVALALPVIGAPAMTDKQVAQQFSENGALAILPAGETQLQDVQDLRAADEAVTIGVAVRNAPDAFETAVTLHAAGASVIYYELDDQLDLAIESLKLLAQQVPPLTILVGPVADEAIARQVLATGIDALVVAPTPGQLVYTVTTTLAFAELAAEFDAAVILGAGIRYSGDIVKAIAAGAIATMVDDQIMTGDLTDNLFQIAGGLRSGMGYTGAATINQLREEAQFVQITAAGLAESHPHDVELTKDAPNYAKN